MKEKSYSRKRFFLFSECGSKTDVRKSTNFYQRRPSPSQSEAHAFFRNFVGIRSSCQAIALSCAIELYTKSSRDLDVATARVIPSTQ